MGKRNECVINAGRSTDKSKISVLGHNGLVDAYKKDVNPIPTIRQTNKEMVISVTRSHRIYNDRKWNNPIVVKITEIDINEE